MGKLRQATLQGQAVIIGWTSMMQRYDDAAAKMYGSSRLATIQQILSADGLAVEAGKIKRDIDARIEIVRLK
jgi:hypothetical protein